MAASAMTETMMPPEMLAKLSVRVIYKHVHSLTSKSAISPNLLHPLLPLSAILMDLRLPERYLKSVQDSLPRYDGKEATAQYSRLTRVSRLLQ